MSARDPGRWRRLTLVALLCAGSAGADVPQQVPTVSIAPTFENAAALCAADDVSARFGEQPTPLGGSFFELQAPEAAPPTTVELQGLVLFRF